MARYIRNNKIKPITGLLEDLEAAAGLGADTQLGTVYIGLDPAAFLGLFALTFGAVIFSHVINK